MTTIKPSEPYTAFSNSETCCRIQCKELHGDKALENMQLALWRLIDQLSDSLVHNPKVQYRQYQSLQLHTILSQIYPSPILTTYYPKINFNIKLPSLQFYTGRFPTDFATKIVYAFLVSLTLATSSVPVLDFTILTIGDLCKSRSSSKCNLTELTLNCPLASSYLGPYIFRITLFSNTCNLYSLKVRNHVL